MNEFITVLAVFLYLAFLIYGTHFIRTWAFNRHEAITFESSSIAALLALLLIWQYGLSDRLIILFVVLLTMFIANAFSQWHFYMVLQDIIKKAFSNRAEYLRKQGFDASVNDSLLTMASVAIMPSFSRFIEESKVFNNPGGFIGLVKSIMKRQRFQKKKYLMRECFAENVNLIGPCKPEIDSMMLDAVHVVPGAVHANDLALDYKDEKKGLFSFDFFGMGAHVAIFAVLLFLCFHPLETAVWAAPGMVRAALMCLAVVLFTVISHVLRHFGFARYESISYEFSFSALVVATFRVFDLFIRGEEISLLQYLVAGAYFLLFVIFSYGNKRLDKSLHKKINDCYDRIIYKTPLDTETDRTKRKFLNNLKYISEWTIVPFPGGGKRSDLFKKIAVTDKIRRFEEINRKKQDMPGLTEGLIDKIVPEFSAEVTEDDFKHPDAVLKRSKLVTNSFCTVAFVLLFVLIGLGIL